MVIVVLTNHGTKIGKKDLLFKFGIPKEDIYYEELIPAEQIEQIIVESSASISTAAIELAAKYAIPITIMSGSEALAGINPFITHGTVKVRRAQMEAYNEKKAVDFVEGLLEAATKSKIRVIKDLIKTREENEEVEEELVRIEKIMGELKSESTNIEECREYFFAREAEITKRYYNCVKILLKERLGFETRNRRPPKDPVNALLSYGYVILTTQVYRATIIAGLEPYAGFLHTDRAGKISFILDIIELFRQPIIDRIVWKMVAKKEVKEEDFQEENGKIMMKEETKKKFLEVILGEMREKERNYGGKVTNYNNIIIDQIRKAGQFFRRGGKYTAYYIKKGE